MSDSMKDFPAKLRFNVAACELAETMYAKYCEAYSLPLMGFRTMPGDLRTKWINRAALALQCTHSSETYRAQHEKETAAMDQIVAECWGTPPLGSDLAADLARESFHVVPRTDQELQQIAAWPDGRD